MNALIKNVIVVTVGTVGIIAASLWLVLPSLQTVDNLNKQLVDQKTQMVNLQQQIKAYQTAESDLKKAVNKDEILDAILVKENMVTVIKQMEVGITTSKATEPVLAINDPFITTVNAAPKNTGKKDVPIIGGLNSVVFVSYSLTLKDDFAGMISLFSSLEHLPNFTEFSTFQLAAETAPAANPDVPPPHTGMINASINGIFYAQKDATTPNK